MNYLGVVSHATGAAAYLFLGLLLLTAWRGRLQGGLLVAVALLSSAWCAGLALHAATGAIAVPLLGVLEIGRDLAWFLFGFKILRYATGANGRHLAQRSAEWAAYAICVAMAATVLLGFHPRLALPSSPLPSYVVLGFLAISVIGWTLVEQIYRNTRREHRWAIKFLCLGMGGAFAYDFVIYAGAVLVGEVEGELWNARGLVQAMIVPLVAVSAARNPQWSVEVFVSRQIVFHTATILGAGGYLVAMAAVGYYIREVGGSWGGVAQITFLCGSLLLLLMLFFSGGLRARVRVFVAKHFFKNKYDYREEWLRFTHTLASPDGSSEVRQSVIRATCAIVESPGGVLWTRRENGNFEPVARWQCGYPPVNELGAESSLVSFLEASRWVVFLDEYRKRPEHYEGLGLPRFLDRDKNAWVIVPLLMSDRLFGFIIMQRSGSHPSLNWEDSDLFKAVGQQSASYLALWETTQALAESRQFEAFNRLSSYVVHDLKNVVAQLSLVGENSKKHIDNPAFVHDALETVANATGKMKRMLAQLRKGPSEETSSRMVNVDSLLKKVVRLRSNDRPVPSLQCQGAGLIVRADPDRLSSVFEHLIQNAQEATPQDGRVAVRTRRQDDTVLIEIEDTGCGMDEEFIRDRLYKPFDTTKGNAGMGIGVYEARDFVVSSGGDVRVRSTPGKGTTFTVEFPSDFDGVEASATAPAFIGSSH